jgi:hypothetical protein
MTGLQKARSRSLYLQATFRGHSERLGLRAMKSGEWKTYRTRFLVKAKQLSSTLSFVDPLGRQHCGRKGDYLVESSDGVISIAPRQIFEDIYVAMTADEDSQVADHAPARLGPASARATDRTTASQPQRAHTFAVRKLPQACRDRRPNPSVGYM